MSYAKELRSIINDYSAYNLNLEDYGLTLRDILQEDRVYRLRENLDEFVQYGFNVFKFVCDLYREGIIDLLKDQGWDRELENLSLNFQTVNQDHGIDAIHALIDLHKLNRIDLTTKWFNVLTLESAMDRLDLETLDISECDDDTDTISLHHYLTIDLGYLHSNGYYVVNNR